jgi:hypothetical protein
MAPIVGQAHRLRGEEVATDAVALQLVVEDVAIRPIVRTFHETGADRIFLDIEPFVVQRFIGAKQAIENV